MTYRLIICLIIMYSLRSVKPY